jgi:hypothetical protein
VADFLAVVLPAEDLHLGSHHYQRVLVAVLQKVVSGLGIQDLVCPEGQKSLVIESSFSLALFTSMTFSNHLLLSESASHLPIFFCLLIPRIPSINL